MPQRLARRPSVPGRGVRAPAQPTYQLRQHFLQVLNLHPGQVLGPSLAGSSHGSLCNGEGGGRPGGRGPREGSRGPGPSTRSPRAGPGRAAQGRAPPTPSHLARRPSASRPAAPAPPRPLRESGVSGAAGPGGSRHGPARPRTPARPSLPPPPRYRASCRPGSAGATTCSPSPAGGRGRQRRRVGEEGTGPERRQDKTPPPAHLLESGPMLFPLLHPALDWPRPPPFL